MTKDLRVLKVSFGIEVAKSRRGIIISQCKYILDLLKEKTMIGSKPVDTPMESNHHLHGDDGALLHKI